MRKNKPFSSRGKSTELHHAKVKKLLVSCIIAASLTTTSGFAGGGPEPTGPYGPARFEKIPGTDLKRVILDEKSVGRLGIKTSEISQTHITRTRMLGGKLVLPIKKLADAPSAAGFGGFGGSPAVNTTASYQTVPERDPERDWIKVTLTKSEWQRIDAQEPVLVYPLNQGSNHTDAIKARLSELPPIHDVKRSMLQVYYHMPVQKQPLALNKRVRVEVTLKGNDETHLTAPYDAILYDGKGKPWVYVNSDQWTYERKPVKIKRIEQLHAVLDSGPDIGTPVVTVGAPLLYGAEVIFKK